MVNSNSEKNNKQFEDLIAWQKAKKLLSEVILFFSNIKYYWYKDQLFRAAMSISNNIAEGFERKSNKEFIYFLTVAKGSCGELRSMLYVAIDLSYCDKEKAFEFREKTLEISRIIQGLINYLQTKT